MLKHVNRYARIAAVCALLAAVTVTLGAGSNASDQVTVPETTAIHVRLDNVVATNESRPGDHFEATVSRPVVVDGKTVIPEGAQVRGLVVESRHSGRLKGRARLQLALETVSVNGSRYEVRTASDVRVGRGHKVRNLAWIGGGAGGGLIIGAIAAGGKGALIGGPIGAGAGVAVAFLTGRKDIRLPAETPLTFRLSEPVAVSVRS